MSDNQSTPSLEEVLTQAIEDFALDLHTCIPAIVQSYNPSKGTCDVKIALKRKYILGDKEEVIERPVIPSVPVLFPRGGSSSFTFPIKAGDNVHLIFSERSTEVWKNSTGVVDPRDGRKFNLSDAFIIPASGRTPIAGASASKSRIVNDKSIVEMSEAGEIVIKNDQGTVTIKTSGEIELKGPVASATLKASGDIDITNAVAMLKLMVSGMINLQNAAGGITVLPSGGVAITGPSGGMTVSPAGKISIGTPDLLNSISQLCAALISATAPTLAPAFSAATITQIQAVKTAVDAIKV